MSPALLTPVLPGRVPSLGRLGFGCSGLMARLDRRQSMQLLQAALEAGISHFDTARSYGYGAAESVLGEFIAGRRDQVTVTTKLGILPPSRSLRTVAMPVARRLAAWVPGLRRAMRRRAAGMVQMAAFDVPTMQRSLHSSLRALRTDRVDLLLLHECRPADLQRDDVLTFLQRVQAQGMVGEYGIGTDVETVRIAVAQASPAARTVQFRSSAFDTHVDHVAAPPQTRVLTHSALAPPFAGLLAWLRREPDAARAWGRALDIDPTDAQALGRLFLAAALAANPHGTVLFSSTDPGRIRQNARLPEAAIEAGQIATLRRLAAEWAAPVRLAVSPDAGSPAGGMAPLAAG